MKINNERTNKCRDHYSKLLLTELANYNVWIAGGCVRTWFANERRSDIDLFAPNEKELKKALNHIKGYEHKIVFENNNAVKLWYNGVCVDFCKKYFKDPEDTINNFDFTVTMAAIDKDNSYFGESFFMDLASKRLAINRLLYPVSTLSRLQKYHKRGYFICKEELLKIVAGLHQINIDDFVVREDNESVVGHQSDSRFPGID